MFHNTLHIRLMHKKDLQPLAEAYVAAYEQQNIGEHWTIGTAKQLLAYWLKKQPDLAFVAECDGKPVGAFIAGIKPWWDGNHLFDGELFVHPDFQKQGVGTELSKVLYKTAFKKYKVTKYDAFTFKKIKFPLQWYKKQGFIEQKEWTIISGDVREIIKNL